MTGESAAMLCNSEHSMLLIIDVQTHLTAVMPAKVLARLQRNMGLLLKTTALMDIPVFATEQYPKGLGPLENTIVELLPEDARRYEKTCFSCAGVEGFLDDLEDCGRKQVIIAGMEAHVCVLQTAMELQHNGYDVYVVADAVCSRHRESYETALSRLRAGGISVLDAESVLFEWLRDAANEQFKAIQPYLR